MSFLRNAIDFYRKLEIELRHSPVVPIFRRKILGGVTFLAWHFVSERQVKIHFLKGVLVKAASVVQLSKLRMCRYLTEPGLPNFKFELPLFFSALSLVKAIDVLIRIAISSLMDSSRTLASVIVTFCSNDIMADKYC